MNDDDASGAVEHVRQVLDELGFDTPIHRFEQPVPTAAAAAEQLGCPVAAIANSLVFTAGDGMVLVLASGAHRVDVGRIAAHLGLGKRKVRRAGPDLVLEVTGQPVGGVAPIGHRTALTTLVDRDLAEHDVLWAGAGDQHSMFATGIDDLVSMTGGTLLEVAPPDDEPPTPPTTAAAPAPPPRDPSRDPSRSAS